MINNYLSPLEFRVAIKRLPAVEFFVQRAMLPSISAQPVEVPNPFNRTFNTPDKLNFSPLDLTFVIDENMHNYLEIRNWINDITAPRNFNEFKRIADSQEGLESDITIQILNSNKNLNLEAHFVNCFPISISDVMLDTTAQDVTYPEATATFQYESFTIKKIG
jgi:hypothetical protein